MFMLELSSRSSAYILPQFLKYQKLRFVPVREETRTIEHNVHMKIPYNN